MITITKTGLTGCQDHIVDELRREFDEKKCTVLPRLLEDKLLDKILENLDTASFYENQHTASGNVIFASDLSVPTKSIVLHQLNFVFNNPKLFRLIEAITGCAEIRGFSGRIYRNMPGTDHFLDWHDDTSGPTRLIGLSINLSKERYEGGLFQIREKKTRENLKEVSCSNPGDAHIFKVSPHLEHCVTAVSGNFPRTAGAGWFTSDAALLHN